jgi:hypothetical protein
VAFEVVPCLDMNVGKNCDTIEVDPGDPKGNMSTLSFGDPFVSVSQDWSDPFKGT